MRRLLVSVILLLLAVSVFGMDTKQKNEAKEAIRKTTDKELVSVLFTIKMDPATYTWELLGMGLTIADVNDVTKFLREEYKRRAYPTVAEQGSENSSIS